MSQVTCSLLLGFAYHLVLSDHRQAGARANALCVYWANVSQGQTTNNYLLNSCSCYDTLAKSANKAIEQQVDTMDLSMFLFVLSLI